MSVLTRTDKSRKSFHRRRRHLGENLNVRGRMRYLENILRRGEKILKRSLALVRKELLHILCNPEVRSHIHKSSLRFSD